MVALTVRGTVSNTNLASATCGAYLKPMIAYWFPTPCLTYFPLALTFLFVECEIFNFTWSCQSLSLIGNCDIWPTSRWSFNAFKWWLSHWYMDKLYRYAKADSRWCMSIPWMHETVHWIYWGRLCPRTISVKFKFYSLQWHMDWLQSTPRGHEWYSSPKPSSYNRDIISKELLKRTGSIFRPFPFLWTFKNSIADLVPLWNILTYVKIFLCQQNVVRACLRTHQSL